MPLLLQCLKQLKDENPDAVELTRRPDNVTVGLDALILDQETHADHYDDETDWEVSGTGITRAGVPGSGYKLSPRPARLPSGTGMITSDGGVLPEAGKETKKKEKRVKRTRA